MIQKGETFVSVDEDGRGLETWKQENGFPDLVLGGRFDDETDERCRCYEISSNEYSTENFWIPLFKRRFKAELERGERPRILSVGCGIGVEVEMLCEAGFACYGIDNGNRTKDWPKRKFSSGLLLANAMHMPFKSDSFDAVFCGCVFPHVGVVGDSNITSETYLLDRQKLADEMVRVAKPSGLVVACSPNRMCPFDIFHGREAGSYLPRFNPWGSRFLLSIGDYKRMFGSAGCSKVESLPVEGFWGFVTMNNSIKGRLLSAPIKLAFRLASTRAFRFLRPSPFLPWVAVGGTK
ncbi:class I SAM-dependent methyltransferase [Pelagicoccus sp. SDUM812005]|uniref:class I SAM-dependent methyltransferase n=1 Tax=Pelagicoccus sp. SDUM812005 TaxID=3041257 RepID=UPI00280EDB1B|nr:class I SAM-dependent methyltransferase [Pelagicoccus sp. SDUM812005]MDQ8180652.1 class I SAM-dependent methyltransferase [Pelagicoccus sp. SDUM812005]